MQPSCETPLQAMLCLTAQVVARDNLQSPVVALFIETLNDLIDIHTKRTVAILSSRIPESIWLGIYSVVLLTMVLVGLQTSYGERRNWLSILVLILVFSVVMTLIVDLDRPMQGLLTVNQQAMLDLKAQIRAVTP